MVLVNLNRAIQLLRSHLGGEGVNENANVCKQGERGSFQCDRSHINVFN